MHVPTGFGKNERLSRMNKIKELFTRGSSFYMRPLRIRVKRGDSEVHQVIITVPKRIFAHAVDRNRVKRLIREAYRHHKHIIADVKPQHLAFIYSGDKEVNHAIVDNAVKSALEKINKDHGVNTEP